MILRDYSKENYNIFEIKSKSKLRFILTLYTYIITYLKLRVNQNDDFKRLFKRKL